MSTKYSIDNKAVFEAMIQIRDLASKNGLAVSVVTVEDVALLKGIEEPTDEQADKILDSWEWRHYGDNWADWFEGLEADELEDK